MIHRTVEEVQSSYDSDGTEADLENFGGEADGLYRGLGSGFVHDHE